MSVMSGTFPYTYRVFYMTVICALILNRGAPLLRRPLPLQPDPTNPTRRARSPVPMRSLRQLAASGLSNLPDNPTPLPDEKDGPSSGLSRASSGSRYTTRRQQTPYLCWILQLSSGSSGYMRRYERGYPGEIGRRRIRDGALEVLRLVGGWVGTEGRYLTHHCPSISTTVDMDFGEFHASSAHLGESSVRRYV
jgi:hypothetical protein